MKKLKIKKKGKVIKQVKVKKKKKKQQQKQQSQETKEVNPIVIQHTAEEVSAINQIA